MNRTGYHEAADAAGQRSAMQAAGIPDAEAAELARASKQVSGEKRVFSENEVMEMARDARTILGSTVHAVETLPKVVDLATLAEAQRPGEGQQGVMSLLKGMETSGATVTPERFGELAQSLAKVTNVFGKTIGFTDWGQFFKYAGTAGQHMDPAFIEQKLPHMIQELGGASAGTMFQSMERAIIGQVLTPKARQTMDSLHLFDESKVQRDEKTGSIEYLRPGAIRGYEQYMKDPSAWVKDVLKPALDDKHYTEGERVYAMDSMFANRVTERGMAILEGQDANVQKNAAQIRAARGLEAAPDLVRENPALANRSLFSQIGNTERRAGAPVMSPLIAVEGALTAGVVKMNEAFDRVPGSATATVAGIVGGAGYLGWKTWESGIGDTVKSILRLPETAAKGLVQGVTEGVNQAKAEAATPKAGAEAPPAATAGATDALKSAAATALEFAEASRSLGTVGMMAALASRPDIGMGRMPTAEHLAENPLGIRLPGDPGVPVGPTPAAPDAPGLFARVADAVKSGFQALATSAAAAETPLPAATAPPPAPPAPAPRLTAAETPQQVTNNNQKTVNAPITVNVPVTINATMTNTTPAAVGAAVGAGVHAGVRAGAGALHDGSETK